jgi:DNA-binding NarL/FixJ family response regulator
MPGGTLMVSRATKLFPHVKKRLEDLGFSDVEVTGEEKDSLNMVINEMKPKLILMGSSFYQAGTPYMLGELLHQFPKLNIAALSIHDFPESLATWFIWRGVKSYVDLWNGYEEFHLGLQEVRQGKNYISPNVRHLMDLFPEWPDTKDKITKRQLEIVVFLCNGFIPEHIGEEMHITRRTVTSHLQDIYKMFHVKNREEMVARAWELGLVTEKDMRFIDRKHNDEILPEWAVIKQKMNRRILQYDYKN